MYREEIIIQLVQSERRRHPRMGGKKLYHKLKKAIQEMGIKIGRDKFFALLREENLLMERFSFRDARQSLYSLNPDGSIPEVVTS